MTETAPEIETYNRITLDGEGTLQGLFGLLSTIPNSVPPEAEIVTAANYYGCPPEALEDESVEHEHGPRVAITLEWDA